MDNFPDEFLPLHHKAVGQATGVSAKTLKKALQACPQQFGADSFQTIDIGGRVLYRFNPARHINFLQHRRRRTLSPDDNFQYSPSESSGAPASCSSGKETVHTNLPTDHSSNKKSRPKTGKPAQSVSGADYLYKKRHERKLAKQAKAKGE